MSSSNLDITIGALVAGWVISHLGTERLMLSGMLFALLAIVTILIKFFVAQRGKVKYNVKTMEAELVE